jgi:hypothetical protein
VKLRRRHQPNRSPRRGASASDDTRMGQSGTRRRRWWPRSSPGSPRTRLFGASKGEPLGQISYAPRHDRAELCSCGSDVIVGQRYGYAAMSPSILVNRNRVGASRAYMRSAGARLAYPQRTHRLGTRARDRARVDVAHARIERGTVCEQPRRVLPGRARGRRRGLDGERDRYRVDGGHAGVDRRAQARE